MGNLLFRSFGKVREIQLRPAMRLAGDFLQGDHDLSNGPAIAEPRRSDFSLRVVLLHELEQFGIAIDEEGQIYVADAGFSNVQVFDKTFRLLGVFGMPGLPAGSLNLPAGIAVTRDNLDYFQKFAVPGFKLEEVIFVANQFITPINPAISVYGLGKMEGVDYTPPKRPAPPAKSRIPSPCYFSRRSSSRRGALKSSAPIFRSACSRFVSSATGRGECGSLTLREEPSLASERRAGSNLSLRSINQSSLMATGVIHGIYIFLRIHQRHAVPLSVLEP